MSYVLNFTPLKKKTWMNLFYMFIIINSEWGLELISFTIKLVLLLFIFRVELECISFTLIYNEYG